MIEFEDVSFSHAGTPVLRDTTLTLAPGSLTVLLGPSGAGKTTLLRLCYLDLAPTGGRLRFFGRPVAPRDRNAIAALRRTVGVLPQESRFLEHLSVADNVALPLGSAGSRPATAPTTCGRCSNGSSSPTAPAPARPSSRARSGSAPRWRAR